MSTPQYGEYAPPPAPETQPLRADGKTKNVYETPTNEYDVQVAQLELQRTRVRTWGTVAGFAVVFGLPVLAVIVITVVGMNTVQ